MIKIEFEKLLRRKALVVLTVFALAAVYVWLAFYGISNTFSGVSLEYFWEDAEYRQWKMSQEAALVDEAWIEAIKADYKAFVDANRLSPEDVEKNIAKKKEAGFQIDYTAEEALNDPYNFDYAFGILTDDAYYSREMEYTYLEAFHTYIPLAENPVRYLHDSYDDTNYYWEKDAGISYADYMGYSKGQQADYWNLIDSTYGDLELVIGYSLGWDVLCSVMQYLPFTLGMALIVILGNVFSQEQTTNMVPILRTTKQGRSQLLRRKLVVAAVIATTLWLVFQLVMLLAVSMTYTLRGAACTAVRYSGLPSIYGLSWLRFYLIQCAFSYLGTLVFALFVCCMSSVLKLRLSMPVNLVLAVVTGFPINRFCYSDQAFRLLDKLRALSPAQLMAAYPTLQVYQSYEFGQIIVQLPYMMAFAIAAETIGMCIFLHRREGGK